jgi:hypothetical protein
MTDADRIIVEQIAELLRAFSTAQTALLEKVLRYHLDAQHKLVDRLLAKLEDVLAAAPPGPPSPPPSAPRSH